MNWYLKAFRQYADFSGRARRKEYWMFVLFSFIFCIVAIFLEGLFDSSEGMIFLLYTLAVCIPGLAVTVRRLHDVSQSGWMILIALIPIVGAIWLLVLLVTDSSPGANKYGNNPKEIEIIETNNLTQNSQSQNNIIDIPNICPHCKNPNIKRQKECEWCDSQIC